MRFRTEIEPPKASFAIDHGMPVLLLGSCFTDEIGQRLEIDGFKVMRNPFGPLYNPVSIARCVTDSLSGTVCTGADLVEGPRGYHCLDYSTRFSGDAFRKERPIPIYFSKRVAEAVPPNGWINSHPGLVEQLDYEAELAVVIGRTAKDVPANQAGEYIFGYTILNDVSARVLQTAHKQWYFGKGLDGFTPMGPWITTADEVAFPPALAISSKVNGELRQHSNTSLLMTGIAEIIEELSSGITLLPGTIIATGTPAGVGMGFDPPKFLKAVMLWNVP